MPPVGEMLKQIFAVPLVGTTRFLIALVLPVPTSRWSSFNATRRHVSSNCSSRWHGAASCTHVGFYTAVPHVLAPDDHPVAFPVSGFSDNGPCIVRPALLEDQHRRSWLSILLTRHLPPRLCCRSQLRHHQDPDRRRIPCHCPRRDCCVLRACRADLHHRHH